MRKCDRDPRSGRKSNGDLTVADSRGHEAINMERGGVNHSRREESATGPERCGCETQSDWPTGGPVMVGNSPPLLFMPVRMGW
jgi:hypothetical protein